MSMRNLVLCAGLAGLLLLATSADKPGKVPQTKVNTAGKAPAQLLSEAQAEIEKFHTGSADQLLQAVVNHPDASSTQVEEALVQQMMLYYGDVVGAMTVIPGLAQVGAKGSPLKDAVGKQLVLARRAYAAALNNYLNDTIGGQTLKSTSMRLPAFSNDDAKLINATLRDKPSLDKIVSGFAGDPAPGMGLLSKANLMGLYISCGALAPKSGGFSALRGKLGGGVEFDGGQFLDWAAESSIAMSKMLKDPGGPDMKALQKHCDERILQWFGKDANNPYVKHAKKRLGK
jgi:hypothetical protein